MKNVIRSLLPAVAFTLAFSSLGFVSAASADEPTKITVYKSPTCGCCSKWEQHLKKNGFTVESHSTENMDAVKNQKHVPEAARSCHTAVIGKYVIEGHVPAEDIKRLLKEKPSGVVGLAAPGMPQGSPGMETGVDEHYDVVSFNSKGQTKVFNHH
jgi:hypothetical protein